MDEWLIRFTEPVIVALDLIALAVIIAGTLRAVYDALRFLASSQHDRHERRQIWINYSHWLVGALTFQLAADIVESSIAPDWDSIGRLAAVAVIRTFLNYFLERDAQEVRERQRENP
ncbi:DUF1622 domain-containing protein [Lysobacter sp. LF1]|uniref:DUF1622 domain-containing protein n=1 Tax=Lysobacter stagni TaxID=3045172 RepID=A0ABT6XIL7_9GAMM|nr:DUF1622 domain-containing protein [Lysobacter sp. LF1]MDI9240007.1 DUF1622 domain-containing protein [Lysobacter sp. LF1]